MMEGHYFHYQTQMEAEESLSSTKRRTRAGERAYNKQMELDLPPTPGTPMKSTRSAVKRFYASSLEEDLDMCGKKLKYIVPESPISQLSQPIEDVYLNSTPKKHKSKTKNVKRSRRKSDDFLDTPNKKLHLIDDIIEDDTASDLALDFPFPIPAQSDYCFPGLMEALDPHTDHPELPEPYSHSSADDNNAELNTPRPSPAASPILSPLNPMTPMTPQTPATPGAATPSRSSSRKKSFKTALSPQTQMKNQLRSMLEPDLTEWGFMRDGVILDIKMRDFMKHKKKHIVWGPHLNLVTGDNGSGKTAIQTAIMFALGANAQTTGRNDSLKKFIRRGSTKAVVEVTIANYAGTHSKRRFGELIRIERTLTKSSNILRIQLADGSWLDKVKKKDWELIIRPLQIHVTNPVQFLTQKTATEFLQNNDPSALFKGFKDVTLITPAEQFLQVSQANIKECYSCLAKKSLEQGEYDRKAKELAELYKRIEEIEQYKVKCTNLIIEYHWSLVRQDEVAKEKIVKEMAEFEKKIEKEVATMKATVEKRDAMKTADKSEKSTLNELKIELEAIESAQEEARNALRVVTKEDKGIQQSIKHSQGYLQRQRNELAELENKLRDSLANRATDEERMKQNYQRQMSEYEEAIKGFEHELADLKAMKVQAVAQQEIAESVVSKHQADLKEIGSQLREKEQEKKRIEHHEDTKIDRFGKDIKTLVRKIELGKWKGRKPLGPLGMWLTVNEKYRIYAPLLEETLGRTFRSFVVSHSDDVSTLRQMIADVCGKKRSGVPGIINVSSPETRTGTWWSKGKAAIEGYPALLDVLDIKDPKVTEALIEKENIEKILLFKTHAEACNVCKNARIVPKNCAYAISLEFYKYTPAPNFAAKPYPHQRTTTTILTTTQFDDVGEIQREIQRLQAEIASLTNFHIEAKNNLESARRIVTKLNEDIRRKTQEVHRAMSLLRTCEQAMSQIPDTATHNDLIEDRKAEIQASILELETELQTQQANREANLNVLQSKETEYQSYNAKIQELQNRIKASSDEAVVLKRQYDEYDKAIRKSEMTIKTLKDNVKALQKQCDTISKQIKKKSKVAAAKGERKETSRSPNEIKGDYDGLKEFYIKNVHHVKAKGEVRRAGIRWERLAKAMYTDINFVRQFLKKTLEPIVNSQATHLSKKEHEYLQCFENYYMIFVERRGYGGEVIYDVKDQKLLYYMTPDHDSSVKIQSYFKQKHDGSRDVDWRGLKDFIMGLSGGEKSFSNLAYIAALRQIMSSPFFMMDEFEVFMDAANRKAGCDILVDQAKNQADAQFFVFSPGELEFPQDDNFIKIFCLKKIEDDESN